MSLRRRPLIQSSLAYKFSGGAVFGSMPAGSLAGQVAVPSLYQPTFSILTANSGLAIDAATGRVTISSQAPSSPTLLSAGFRAVDAAGKAIEGVLVVSILPPALAGLYDILAGALDNWWDPNDPAVTTQSGGKITAIVDKGALRVDMTQPDATLAPAASGDIAASHVDFRPAVTSGKRNRLRNLNAGITRGAEFLGEGSTAGSMSFSAINGATFLETPANTYPVGSSFLLGVVWDENRVRFFNALTEVYSIAQSSLLPGAVFVALNLAATNAHAGRVLRLGPTISALGDQADADGATVTQSFTWNGAIGSIVRVNGRIAL